MFGGETLSIDLYPDLRELDPDERCEIPGMTIAGKPAYLFSSRNQKTVSRHFPNCTCVAEWLSERSPKSIRSIPL